MGNLGGAELLVIFLVGLVVLGPTKLPDAARQIGKAVNELRRISGGFQQELRDALHEPVAETKAILDGNPLTDAPRVPPAPVVDDPAVDDPPTPDVAEPAEPSDDV